MDCLEKEHKMALICGPRQVGKTTLAKHILELKEAKKGYFNWDIESHRKAILRGGEDFWRAPLEGHPKPCVVLDEIHKYPRWKRFLKGFYDAVGKETEIVVTGSGRLNIYQRGGDSLFGRYHLFHLFPWSVGEVVRPSKEAVLTPEETVKAILEGEASGGCAEALEQLENYTGFPEPFFGAGAKILHRWRREHRNLILREDLRDLTRIRDIGLMDALVDLLPDRVGSPLSLNALREDLNVAFNTVKNWIRTLSFLYYLFEIRPYSGKIARAIRKEAKIYLFDTSVIEDRGKRFENIAALHLLKACHAWSDFGCGDYDLHYVRDKEKREADFLVTENGKPWLLLECKMSQKEPDPSLRHFSGMLKPRYVFQLVRSLESGFFLKKTGDIFLVSAPRFLAHLP